MTLTTETDYENYKEDVKYITNLLNRSNIMLCMLTPVLNDALIYEVKSYIELTPSRKQELTIELRRVEERKARLRPRRQHLRFCKKHKLDPSIIREIKRDKNKFHLFYRDYTGGGGLAGIKGHVIVEPGVIYEGSAPAHVARAAEALAKDYHYFL